VVVVTHQISVPAPGDLLDSDLFRDVSERGLADAIRCARVRQLPKGVTIFTQDQPADRAHSLLAGRVRIAQGDADGGQLLVRFVGPGETFGTLGLFTGHRYPADAATVTDSAEMSWTEAALLGLIARYPQIAVNLVKIAGERLRDAENRLRELATQRVERRIAHAILRLTEKAGPATDNGTAIGFPLSRKDLAEMCGTTLHTVSRILTAWEREGWIETHQQRIAIRNPAVLRKMADEP
jgi:CRP-like cAMP-binding protein